jgi:hypothetical protein
MPEPNTSDRNSHGSRVHEISNRKIAARFSGRLPATRCGEEGMLVSSNESSISGSSGKMGGRLLAVLGKVNKKFLIADLMAEALQRQQLENRASSKISVVLIRLRHRAAGSALL